MWDLKLDTRRLVEGFSTSVLWERPNVLWNKADDWWNDNYVTDPSTAAFLSATGIIDPNKQNYVNNLVIALKNQGLWNKMKAIYPFVSEQRNLLNNTDTFSGWALENGTLTGGFTDPQGGTTAYKYATAAGGGLWANQGFTLASTTYTQSIWVKSVSGTNTTFDLSSGNGPMGKVTLTATATWQRVFNTNTFDAGGSFYLYNISDTVNGIYIWHPQMELGNLTDYQVTINAQEQFAAAYKYNLKDPQNTDAAFRLKIFGTWTFTPTGAKGNGTNAYMDSGFNPSAQSINNNTHISYYSRSNIQEAAAEIGIFKAPYDRLSMELNYYYLGVSYGFNSDQYNYATGRVSAANTNTQGFYIGSRTNSTTHKAFKNNSQIGTTNTGSSGNVSNIIGNIYIGGTNGSGSAPTYSSKQCAFASIGDGLTDAEALAFYNIVQQFQTSMNRQINP